MSKYVVVPEGDFKVKVQDGGQIIFDTGLNLGQVTITGNLLVQGTTTTVQSNSLEITDNIIELNGGETGPGVSLDEAGLKINRGSFVDAFFLFDENISWLDPNTGSLTQGAFTFRNESDELLGIKTNSITTGGEDLYLINQGAGVISVTGTVNYETNVTDDDDIPNKKYVDDKILTLLSEVEFDKIVSKDDPFTYVWAQSDVTKRVNIVINGVQTGLFTEGTAEFFDLGITGRIKTSNDLTLVLDPGGVGNVSVSNSRIVSLNDPINAKDAVNLQFLEDKLSTIDNLGDVDISNFLQNGSVLVWNSLTSNFESTLILENQIIDGGTY